MSELAPGTVVLGHGFAIPVHLLRAHTADIHRFLRCLPTYRDIELNPSTLRDSLHHMDPEELQQHIDTMNELAALYASIAAHVLEQL
jgi:hypothetical protein